MAPMEYSPNGKDFMAPMGDSPIVYSRNGKAMVLWKIVFWSVNHHGKTRKMQYERDNVNQN